MHTGLPQVVMANVPCNRLANSCLSPSELKVLLKHSRTERHKLVSFFTFSPGDNEEELVVGWQEKLFSQVHFTGFPTSVLIHLVLGNYRCGVQS